MTRGVRSVRQHHRRNEERIPAMTRLKMTSNELRIMAAQTGISIKS